MGSGGGLWEGPATNPPYGDLLSHDRLNQKTLFIGSSDPATTFAGMLYYNTSTNTLEIRKADNDSWFIGLNQSLKSTDSPIFAGLTLTAFSGFVRATAGVISASALIASDIPSLAASKITSGTFGTSYLDLSALAQNIAFTSTQTVDGRDISADIDQHLLTTSSPTFAGLKVGGNILTEGNYIFTDATATNKRILISGGSASITDGAYFGLYGITYSGSEGRMELQAGNVNNAHAVIAFYTPDTTPNLQLRMTINQGALGNSGISIYEPVTITDTFMPQFKVAYDAARYLTFTHANITGTYGAYANDLAITVASAGAGGGNILLTPLAGAIVIASTAIKAAGYQSSDGTAGETFSAVTCKTLTVKNGLVVAHTT